MNKQILYFFSPAMLSIISALKYSSGFFALPIFFYASFYLIIPSSIVMAQSLDRPPSQDEVHYSPYMGARSATNPPAFIWLPHSGVESWTLQYSQDRSFSPSATVTVSNLDMTVHVPSNTMSTGIWYWRYGYQDGTRERYSMKRHFEIPESAVEFPLVTADQMIQKIPVERPRLYFSPELVHQIRTDRQNNYSFITQPVIDQAEEILAMNEPLFEEPEDWIVYRDTGRWIPEEREHYIESWRTMRPYTQRMVTSALAWLYTGDERYAAEARRRLMHFMSWDVQGSSSTIFPTELGMDIAENATPVFDWIYETLTEEERRICIEVLTARMIQINRDVHRARPMESRPFSSHPGRMVGFAIEGGIVLAHETPEAEDWLDYTLTLLWSTYPAWGNSDGGWHEGVSYWGSYMRRMTRVVHELGIHGIPLYNKPFFQNTGYFGLYAAYPGRPTRAFGDGHHQPTGSSEGMVTYILSSLYDNPWFRWHADNSGAGPAGRKAMRVYRPDLEARPPSLLPASRVFYDVGLAALHSNMDHPEDNVMMLLKSNPYGGISHNHASQNAFVVEAFGEALAISSGYRTTHGIPHHTDWIWQTRAHNSILVNGTGQIPRSRDAGGRIIDHYDAGPYVYVTGDATTSYGDLLDRFHRHVVFVRPGYFVVIDDIQTQGDPATLQWLFHAKNEIQVDPESLAFVSTSGNARLAGRFLTPQRLGFTQRTGFDPPTQNPATSPDQFHLTVTTRDALPSTRFVTVMWVDRPGPQQPLNHSMSTGTHEPGIRILRNTGIADQALLAEMGKKAELLEATGGIALRVGYDLILWKEQGSWRVEAAGVTSTKRMEIKQGFFR